MTMAKKNKKDYDSTTPDPKKKKKNIDQPEEHPDKTKKKETNDPTWGPDPDITSIPKKE